MTQIAILICAVPVHKTTKEHGKLGTDDCHHHRGNQAERRQNSIDDGHAAKEEGCHSKMGVISVTWTRF